jgi:hypothetical protein
MQRCPRSVKRVGATWGISDNVCHMCILCSYAGTLTTITCDYFVRSDYRDECDFATDYTYAIYILQPFFWRGTYRADILHGIVHSYCIKNIILKTKRNLKIDSNSKSYLENLSNFKPSWSIHLISKFWVVTLFRKLMEVSTALIFRVFLDFASIKLKFWSQ